MLSLTIGGKPAYIKPGTTFKLTRPNPLLTSSSSSSTDYTMEIQLPLDGCADNWAIFAPSGAYPQQPAAALLPLVGKEWAARLVAPPLVIDGTAKLTGLSDGTAKVQFTSRLAVTDNLTPAQEATYIDTLPLGYCFKDAGLPATITVKVPYYGDGNRQGAAAGAPAGYDTRTLTWMGESECSDALDESVRLYLRHAFCFQPEDGTGLSADSWDEDAPASGTWSTKVMYGTPEDTDSVLFPVSVDEASFGEEDPATTYSALLNLQNGTLLAPEVTAHPSLSDTYYYSPATAPISPQPYFLPLLRDVFACFGYEKGDWSFYEKSALFRGLICVSPVIDNVRRARCLPHWKLSELITEVQNFFQCLIVARTGADGVRYVDLVPLAAYSPTYAGQSDTLAPLAADFQEATVESSSAVATAAAGNVCFDLEETCKQTALPLTAWTGATVSDFSTMEKLKAQAEADKEAGDYAGKIYRYLSAPAEEGYWYKVRNFMPLCAECYAWLRTYTEPAGSDLSDTWALTRVDGEAPLWRDLADDSQTKLRIVPCSSRQISGGAYLPSAVPPSPYLAGGTYATLWDTGKVPVGYTEVSFVTVSWCKATPYSRPALRTGDNQAGYSGNGTEWHGLYRHALRLPKTYAVYRPGYSLSGDIQGEGSDSSSKYQSRLYLAHYYAAPEQSDWVERGIWQPVWKVGQVGEAGSVYNTLTPVRLGTVKFPQASAMDALRELWKTDGSTGSGLTDYYDLSLPPTVSGYSRFAVGQTMRVQYLDTEKSSWPYYLCEVFSGAGGGKVGGRLIRRYTFPSPVVEKAAAGGGMAMLSPTSPYVIGGRPLVCQKLEYTIGSDGIEPPVTGYFAEWGEDS